MNRRIVLVDREETTDYFKYFGCGLGDEVYVLQELKARPEEEIKKILTLGNSDAVMLVKGEPFKYLQEFYHFGIRNENYADCAKLRRLSIEGGSFAKCVMDFPDKAVIQDFMSPEFTVHRDFSWFQHKVIHTFPEAMNFLEYLESLPLDTNYGFDYEASGMPLDVWFEISGASICTTKYGGFISFTDIRDSVTQEDYIALLGRLGKFLVDRMNHVWTYNMQYEFQVSHRMLGVDLYNLCDASVFNVLDGNHLKKYSLKWTGNMILQSTVWDTEFDRISDLIDSMLFTEVGKLKKEKKKVLKVTPEDFKNTDEWKILCERYPRYIQEFERLILKYWGNAFMCIPSDILGHYCNLDAFYTLMIYETKKTEYSEEAIQVFLDNIRLGCRLHSSGLYIDEDYRRFYQKECHKMMAWGITYCATARCFIKMEKHKAKMANINKYSPECRKLLELGMFFNGDAMEITKYLLTNFLDTMDISDTGLNEGAMMMVFGEDFAYEFNKSLKENMAVVKMKTKIDQTIVRKKKLLGLMVETTKKLLGLDKLKLGEKHLELEKYMYYEIAYNELVKLSKTQLGDINNIPDKIRAFKQEFTLLDYSTYISENYFKCKSPIENDEIITEMFELYKTETSFVAALSESTQQLPGEKKEEFFNNLGLNSIEEGYNHFMVEWEKYTKLQKGEVYNGPYPEKMFNIALESWRGGVKYEPAKDVHPVKDVWADFTGFTTQATFFGEYNNQYPEYGKPFIPEDFNDKFFFMRKFILSYLLYKKYSKVYSTYIGDGAMFGIGKWVIEGEDHIPIREAQEGEPGAVKKLFTKYEVNTKSSKRWSSGFHTIISHSDLKDCLVPPYHYDENGNKVRENFIETYFDIDRVMY